jgi:hypothetical protein
MQTDHHALATITISAARPGSKSYGTPGPREALAY